MKKRIVQLNVGLMTAVVFAICYQSLHAFNHAIQSNTEHQHTAQNTKYKTVFSEKEECLVCDFSFASFLGSDFFTFAFKAPFRLINYLFDVKESTYTFFFTLFSPRGPPY